MDKKFERFTKGKKTAEIQKNDAAVYTRVSTKEQADNNASLATQLKYCKKYAEENGITVLEYFGGTYESAKDDERKEFQRMLSYVKRKKSIGYVIVYSYDRFSRSGPGGAFISHELKKQGIKVISATQSVDHNDPSGNFMEGIYHLFSQFDNQLRRDKSMTGMIEKLKQGYWPFVPPTGYENLNQGKTADQHKLVINKKGMLLRKAFELKANQDLSLVEIAKRLSIKGWVISHKSLSHFLQNPFYCGYLASLMIPGELIEGKHPPLVSKKTFLKVQENMEKFHSGYQIEAEVEALPLKQFVKCEACGKSMTGYLVKNKGLYYYKCINPTCLNNRSQKALHEKFENLLMKYQVDSDLAPVMEEMMLYVLSQAKESKPDDLKALKMERAELRKKLESIEEKYVTGDLEQELFFKYRDKFKLQIEQIEKEISLTENGTSNLEKAVKKAMEISQKLPSLWRNTNFNGKRKLQYLIFPNGISYNRQNDEYLTSRINLLFSGIPHLTGFLGDEKSGNSANYDEISTWVVPPRIELGSTV